MIDKFHSLPLRQAIAVQIFYTSPEDENLHGKILNSFNWADIRDAVQTVTFRETGTAKDEALEKLIAEKSYKEILEKYDKPGATFEMVVIYKHDEKERKEMNLTDVLKSTFSPLELPKQIMEFLKENEVYSFLKE